MVIPNFEPACCACYDPKYDSLIYESKFTLSKLSWEIVKQMYYGYNCDDKAVKKMDLLQRYISVVEDDYRKVALGGDSCFSCRDRQTLSEKIRRLTTRCDIDCRKDIVKDSSGVDAWVAKHPNCVSRERWERIAYIVCDAINLEIEIVDRDENECDISLEVMSKEMLCDLTFEISRKIIPCDIILAISIFQEMCDLNFEIERSIEECAIDFKLLKEQVECDINFDFYKKLIDCNISFDIIKTVYENDCVFEIGDSIELVTPLNRYPLDKLKFTGIPDVEKLERLGIDTTDSEFVRDPQEFIRKLKQDYGR